MKNLHSVHEVLECPVCHSRNKRLELYPGNRLRSNLIQAIQSISSEWTIDQSVCANCLRIARFKLVEDMLKQDKGEIGAAENEVLKSIENQTVIAQEQNFLNEKVTFGNALSDKIASIGGSWFFIITFLALLTFWIILNSLMLKHSSFDPYPYILLNLILSCVAALQAPVIMMSQNRKEAKDRARAESDYKTNLKAELEIRHLNIKIDELITHQWQHLIEFQQMQLDILEEINESKNRK